MAILKHIVSKSSNYGAALEYLIFKHDELRKAPILDQNGNRIMRDEFYLDGLNCEPYSFDAACQQLNCEYQKNKNKRDGSLYFYCKFCHVSISEKDLWNGIHKELHQRMEEHKNLKKLIQKNSGNSNLETRKKQDAGTERSGNLLDS